MYLLNLLDVNDYLFCKQIDRVFFVSLGVMHWWLTLLNFVVYINYIFIIFIS